MNAIEHFVVVMSLERYGTRSSVFTIYFDITIRLTDKRVAGFPCGSMHIKSSVYRLKLGIWRNIKPSVPQDFTFQYIIIQNVAHSHCPDVNRLDRPYHATFPPRGRPRQTFP